jgi:hypothetical protein
MSYCDLRDEKKLEGKRWDNIEGTGVIVFCFWYRVTRKRKEEVIDLTKKNYVQVICTMRFVI